MDVTKFEELQLDDRIIRAITEKLPLSRLRQSLLY